LDNLPASTWGLHPFLPKLKRFISLQRKKIRIEKGISTPKKKINNSTSNSIINDNNKAIVKKHRKSSSSGSLFDIRNRYKNIFLLFIFSLYLFYIFF
jgi:hypothetical protein